MICLPLKTDSLRLLHITNITFRVTIDSDFLHFLEPLFRLLILAESFSSKTYIGLSLHHCEINSHTCTAMRHETNRCKADSSSSSHIFYRVLSIKMFLLARVVVVGSLS
ncbi:hypothetical protein Hanom_Chr08g00696161 [Helianthus anomalus]